MLRNLILSGRLGKWAYAMVEYDLAYKPLRAKKGQVDADIIVDHDVRTDHEVLLAESVTWKLFFDGSVCGHRHGHGHGVGCFIVSWVGMEYELSIQLDFDCTNNQAKYEALLSGLEVLRDMEVKDAMKACDSKLVVQQITGESQCLDRTLNMYREKSLEMLDSYHFVPVSRDKNVRANLLALQASGYEVKRGRFEIRWKQMLCAIEGNHDELERDTEREDWRKELIDYISNHNSTQS
jgi:ribonuclease HI